MATQLFLRNVASPLGGAGQGALSTARGAASVGITTNTAAGGTSIPATVTAGGDAATWWFRVGAGSISGNLSANIRGRESNAAANAGVAIDVDLYEPDGVTLIGSLRSATIPASVTEFTTTDAAKALAAAAVTTRAATNGCWVRVRLRIVNAGGTMAAGYTVVLTLDGPTAGAAGDSSVTFANDLPVYVPDGVPVVGTPANSGRAGDGNITLAPPAGTAYLAVFAAGDGNPTVSPPSGFTYLTTLGSGVRLFLGSAGAGSVWGVSGSADAADPHILTIYPTDRAFSIPNSGVTANSALSPSVTSTGPATFLHILVGANTANSAASAAANGAVVLNNSNFWSASGGYGMVQSATRRYADAASASGTQAFTIPSALGSDAVTLVLVAATDTAPVITTTSLGTLTMGTEANVLLSATGTPVPTFAVQSGALPAGLSLTSGGLITGVPTTAGPYSVTIRATNSVGFDDQVFSGDVATGPTLVWASEFNGAAGTQDGLAAQWEFEVTDDPPNGEYQAYTGRIDNITQTGTALDLVARREAYGTKAWTSGRIRSNYTFVPNGGTTIVEIRAKVPVGKALWSAGWMIGPYEAEDWPACGEIDIWEIMNNTLDIWMDVHGATNDGSGEGHWHDQTMWYAGGTPFANDYHVFRVEWSTTQIVWKVDGVVRKTFTRAGMPANRNWEFDSPFSVILNLAVGGDWPGAPDGTTPDVSHMLVDYVRVYDATVAPRSGAIPEGGFSSTYSYGPAAFAGKRASKGGLTAAYAYGPAAFSGRRPSGGGFSATYGWGPAALAGKSPRYGSFAASVLWGEAAFSGDVDAEGGFSAAWAAGPAQMGGQRRSAGGFSAEMEWGLAEFEGAVDYDGTFGATLEWGPATFVADNDAEGTFGAAVVWGPAGFGAERDSEGSFEASVHWGPATFGSEILPPMGAFSTTYGWGPGTFAGDVDADGAFAAAAQWGPASFTGDADAEGSFGAAVTWGPGEFEGERSTQGGFSTSVLWGMAQFDGVRISLGWFTGSYGWGPAQFAGPTTEFCWPDDVGVISWTPRYGVRTDSPQFAVASATPRIIIIVEDSC